jgi:hypothetical protein
MSHSAKLIKKRLKMTNLSPSDLAEIDKLLEDLDDAPIVAGSNGLDDLEVLLAESVAARDHIKRVKEQRKLLAQGKIAPEDRKQVADMIHDWELKKEWVAAAAVHLFSSQQCSNCGNTHYHFLGVYQRQVHKVSPTISRWIKSDDISNKGLPQEAKLEESHAPTCADCSSAFEDA